MNIREFYNKANKICNSIDDNCKKCPLNNSNLVNKQNNTPFCSLEWFWSEETYNDEYREEVFKIVEDYESPEKFELELTDSDVELINKLHGGIENCCASGRCSKCPYNNGDNKCINKLQNDAIYIIGKIYNSIKGE